MSLLQAIKIAFTKDIEDTIKKHKEIPLGQFTSEAEVQKTTGMIVAWEKAVAHFKLICDTIEGSANASADQLTPPPAPSVTDAEIEVIPPQ